MRDDVQTTLDRLLNAPLFTLGQTPVTIVTLGVFALPWRVPDRDPRVLLTGFADSAVTFEIQVWTHDPWGARGATSDLNEAIWHGLQGAGVAIPFPQLDVHVQSSSSERQPE